MNQPTSQQQNAFNPFSSNLLLQYVQSLDSQTVQHLSQTSKEVMQIIEGNIIQTLGGLPPQHFDVNITTSRENLGQLLASAMMSGYFLRKAEERFSWEKQIADVDNE